MVIHNPQSVSNMLVEDSSWMCKTVPGSKRRMEGHTYCLVTQVLEEVMTRLKRYKENLEKIPIEEHTKIEERHFTT